MRAGLSGYTMVPRTITTVPIVVSHNLDLTAAGSIVQSPQDGFQCGITVLTSPIGRNPTNDLVQR